MSNLDKLNKIFKDLFNVKAITEEMEQMGPSDIEDWDSLGHIDLVTELEEAFEISIAVEDVSRMYTIGDVKKILGKYGVEI